MTLIAHERDEQAWCNSTNCEMDHRDLPRLRESQVEGCADWPSAYTLSIQVSLLESLSPCLVSLGASLQSLLLASLLGEPPWATVSQAHSDLTERPPYPKRLILYF